MRENVLIGEGSRFLPWRHHDRIVVWLCIRSTSQKQEQSSTGYLVASVDDINGSSREGYQDLRMEMSYNLKDAQAFCRILE